MDNNTQYKFEQISKDILEKKDKKCFTYKSAYETCLLVNGMGVISSKCKIEENKLLKCVKSLPHYSSSSNDS